MKKKKNQRSREPTKLRQLEKWRGSRGISPRAACTNNKKKRRVNARVLVRAKRIITSRGGRYNREGVYIYSIFELYTRYEKKKKARGRRLFIKQAYCLMANRARCLLDTGRLAGRLEFFFIVVVILLLLRVSCIHICARSLASRLAVVLFFATNIRDFAFLHPPAVSSSYRSRSFRSTLLWQHTLFSRIFCRAINENCPRML